MAFDPSLWWNNQNLLKSAAGLLRNYKKLEKTLYFASSSDGTPELTQRLADVLTKDAPPSIHWHYEKMPEEKHSTIYHPAALRAFRSLVKPPSEK